MEEGEEEAWRKVKREWMGWEEGMGRGGRGGRRKGWKEEGMEGGRDRTRKGWEG